MSEIPASAKQPQDHKKSAAQIEAEKITKIEITWRDQTFTIDSAAEEWPVQATYAFENRLIATGLRALLGEKQWSEFLRSKPRNPDLSDLFDLIAKTLGLGDAGN